ncbi:polymorphic toxin type 30 domain-containing protein [Streptomyces sp. NPDC054874]
MSLVPDHAEVRGLTPDPDGGAQYGLEHIWRDSEDRRVRLRIHAPKTFYCWSKGTRSEALVGPWSSVAGSADASGLPALLGALRRARKARRLQVIPGVNDGGRSWEQTRTRVRWSGRAPGCALLSLADSAPRRYSPAMGPIRSGHACSSGTRPRI